jgi:hypothetical protein
VPGNEVGPLCATVGLLFATTTASSGIATWGLRTGALPPTFAEYLDCLAAVWVFAVGILGVHLPLRLPDGRLPSPRWRWFSRAITLLLVPAFVSQAALPGRVELVPGTRNPLGAAWAEPLSGALRLLFLGMAVGVAAIVLHYRRGGPVERAQLQWVAFGGVVFVVVQLSLIFGAGLFPQAPRVTFVLDFATAVGFAVLPVCIGIAVLRRGLYDLGVVVRRTVVYAALTVLLAGAYVGTVLLLQLLLSPGSDLAIAGSTLAVAALFRPARTRIQAAVDRRFYRRRYDVARTLERFGARLRDEVDLDALGAELRWVVAETMQPDHVSLWIREPSR